MPPIFKKPTPKKPAPSKPVTKPSPTTAARKDRDFVPPVKAKTPSAPAPKAGVPKPPAPGAVTPGKAPGALPTDTAPGAPAQPKQARPDLEGKTNQDIINVIYKAAEELKMPPWSLLKKAKLEHLVDDRKAVYSGPPVAGLPNLTYDEKVVIQKVLASYVRPKK